MEKGDEKSLYTHTHEREQRALAKEKVPARNLNLEKLVRAEYLKHRTNRIFRHKIYRKGFPLFSHRLQ